MRIARAVRNALVTIVMVLPLPLPASTRAFTGDGTGRTPAARAAPHDSICVRIRDGATARPLVDARLRLTTAGDSASPAWTNAAGLACISPGQGTSPFDVVALGFRPVTVAVPPTPIDTAVVSLERVVAPRGNPMLVRDAEWRDGQVALALAMAVRDLERCASLGVPSCATAFRADTAAPATIALVDSAASAGARERVAAATLPFLRDLVHWQRAPQLQPAQPLRESAGVTLVAYLDVAAADDRDVEIRLSIPSGTGRAGLGVTERRCRGNQCARLRQFALTWSLDDDRSPRPELAVRGDPEHATIDIFDLSAAQALVGVGSAGTGPGALDADPSARAPGASVRGRLVRGTVRDDKGRPVALAEILATPGDQAARTDSLGHFALMLAGGAGATGLLTARAIGYAPAYKTLAADGDSVVAWNPELRSVQLLAERMIRVSGLPPRLSSWRYDEMMARRARGRGQFLIGEEIWAAASLGDALGRIPGVQVKMGRANLIESVRIPRCAPQRLPGSFHAPEGLIGVWIDGFEQTRSRPYQEVLSEIGVLEIIAIEVYRGMSELPGEFASPRYCAAISLWTK